MNPLDFDLAVEGAFDEDKYPSCDFVFLTNLESTDSKMSEYLTMLPTLQELKIVRAYLHISLDDISERLRTKTDMRPMLHEWIEQKDFSHESSWLDAACLKVLSQNDVETSLSFVDLIFLIYKAFQEAHPKVKMTRFDLAGIYMDVLLVGWKWWFRELGKMVLYPKK